MVTSRLLTFILKKKVVLLVLPLAGAILALIVSYIVEPVFEVSVSLFPQEKNTASGAGGIAGGLSLLDLPTFGNFTTGINQDIELFRSHQLVDSLESKLALSSFLGMSDDPESSADKRHWQAFRLLKTRLRIYRQKDSGLVRLGLRASDPVQAASMVAGMIDEVNDIARQRRIHEIEASLNEIHNRIDEVVESEVKRALFELLSARNKTLALTRADEHFAFTMLEEPRAPDLRVWPSRFIFLVTGGLLVLVVEVLLLALLAFSWALKLETAHVGST